jgi:phage terminase small subunit
MEALPEKTPADFNYTLKQEAFCHAYVELQNKSAAYREAYDAENMADRTIGVKAHNMLKQEKIRVLCDSLRAETYERNRATLDEIVHDLSQMVRFDIADLYDENGDLKNIHDMPINARKMIQAVDVEALYDGYGQDKVQIGQTKKLKLLNRLDVLEKLMKYFDGYNAHNKSKSPTNQIMIVQLPENNR